MIDEQNDLAAVFEPWEPEIGQRVTILARPECFYCRADHDAEVGATGVVTAIHAPDLTEPGSTAHRFWVRYDDPDIANRTESGTDESHFAAVELEPLERTP